MIFSLTSSISILCNSNTNRIDKEESDVAEICRKYGIAQKGIIICIDSNAFFFIFFANLNLWILVWLLQKYLLKLELLDLETHSWSVFFLYQATSMEGYAISYSYNW